ncbi:MAG: FHA domain-containing protein [Desulfobacterales bacterium]|nr:FHA domain-containing protein [Desulfobacteraceae bacterium]MBT4364426.1 FHA domain-containing protein [Desulfobacteraceae bacterium]MBT7084713.1 FHA domain-containing protein [Desulfobacterales bacterium]MBT7697461.1 FHA domain-containing protein [Desulfobacterales bacterium]
MTPPSNPSDAYNADSDTIIVGRNISGDRIADIDLIKDEYVSRRHTCITFENNEYWVEDLSSGNGTWVNDEKISEKTRITGK